MRPILFLLGMMAASFCQAQLYLSPDARIFQTGNVVLCLSDINLVNDGEISQDAGTGIVVFTGIKNNTISGSGVTKFDVLEIAKTDGGGLGLAQDIGVNGSIKFTSGLIDLEGRTISLLKEAYLDKESETSRITGPDGGGVTLQRDLNAPPGLNPGNLGLNLTTSANLGSTIITRRHRLSQGDPASAISREFDIKPSNNSGLNAKLRFLYFTAELNGWNEGSLGLWKKENANPWKYIGFDSRDAAQNWVEKTGIESFSIWTLSTSSGLPVSLQHLTAKAADCSVTLNWRSETETNLEGYEVERSANGADFSLVARLKASGNNKNYTFTDRQAQNGKNIYRLKMLDRNGDFGYSSQVAATATCTNRPFSVMPNPALSFCTVAGIGKNETLRVLDASARLLMQKTGNGNDLRVDLQKWARGAYLFIVSDKDNKVIYQTKVIKQ